MERWVPEVQSRSHELRLRREEEIIICEWQQYLQVARLEVAALNERHAGGRRAVTERHVLRRAVHADLRVRVVEYVRCI